MINFKQVLMLTAFLGQISVLSAKVITAKNINYTNKNEERRQLNIYYQVSRPAKTATPKAKDVIIFIHGGSWSSGKKDTYWWLGRNFARKGVVAVTINYGLAPVNQYEQMADDCANAVKWVQQHIGGYGGDPKRIVIAGHSMGGWVTAHAAARHPELAGAILISAADMGAISATAPRAAVVAQMADNMETLAGTSPERMADEVIARARAFGFA